MNDVSDVMPQMQWDLFFTALNHLASSGVPWRDKRAEMRRQASLHDAESDLEEILEWFDEEPV